MSDFLVVDSSVAYKWFNKRDESSVDAALELLEAHHARKCLLSAPAHLPAEVANGLRYARLESAERELAIEGLSGVELALFPLDGPLLSAALTLALRHDLTIHDALFAALAVRLNCGLVTADRVQARVTECPVRLLL